MSRPVRVYIARGLVSGLLKIGHSRDVEARVYSMASQWEPVELLATLDGDASVEAALHRHFAASLAGARGREWFRDDGAIVDFVAALPATSRESRVFKITARSTHHRGIPKPARSTGADRSGAPARWAEFAREHGHLPTPSLDGSCHLCAAERRVLARLATVARKAGGAISREFAARAA